MHTHTAQIDLSRVFNERYYFFFRLLGSSNPVSINPGEKAKQTLWGGADAKTTTEGEKKKGILKTYVWEARESTLSLFTRISTTKYQCYVHTCYYYYYYYC